MNVIVLSSFFVVVSANWPFDNINNPFLKSNPTTPQLHFINSIKQVNDNVGQLLNGEGKFYGNIYEVTFSLHVNDENHIHVFERGNTVYVNVLDGYYQTSIHLPSNVDSACTWYYENDRLTLRFPVKQAAGGFPSGISQSSMGTGTQPSSTTLRAEGIYKSNAYVITIPLHVSDPKNIKIETRGNTVFLNVFEDNYNFHSSLLLPSNVDAECTWHYETGVLTLNFPVKQAVGGFPSDISHSISGSSNTIITNTVPIEKKYTGNTYELALSMHVSNKEFIHVYTSGSMVYVNANDANNIYQINGLQLPSDVAPECTWYYLNDVLTLQFPVKQTAGGFPSYWHPSHSSPTTPHYNDNGQDSVPNPQKPANKGQQHNPAPNIEQTTSDIYKKL